MKESYDEEIAIHIGLDPYADNVSGGTADMNAEGKSDESIVPVKQTNKDRTGRSAESVEESDSIKRNANLTALPRTPSRIKT